MKLTKKALKELAQELGAVYCTGNVYNYENIIYYIQLLTSGKSNGYTEALNNCSDYYKKELEKLLDEIIATDYDSCYCKQLAYSAGVYGNNGQLHEIKLLRDGEEVKTIYLYY